MTRLVRPYSYIYCFFNYHFFIFQQCTLHVFKDNVIDRLILITKRNDKMAKMKVLSSAFDSVPKLTKEATIGYFTLDVETKKILNKMQSDVAKVGYLVSKAYFQAKGRFFETSRYIDADIKRATKVLSLNVTV